MVSWRRSPRVCFHREDRPLPAPRGGIRDGRIASSRALTPDRRSSIARYYYSPFDHAINPTWTRDGKELVFVSNREIAHGTGDIVRMAPPAPTRPASSDTKNVVARGARRLARWHQTRVQQLSRPPMATVVAAADRRRLPISTHLWRLRLYRSPLVDGGRTIALVSNAPGIRRSG